MKTMLKAVALAATALSAGALTSTPAFAQARQAVASADIDGAIQQSAAFTAAVTQIQTTYAQQIAARATRAQALQTELQGLNAVYQGERARTPQNATALQQAQTALQTRQQAAQTELQQLSQPIDLAVTYVREQITLKLADAIRAATTAKRVDVLLSNEGVIWRADAVDITSQVVMEINRLVPGGSVQIVPPAGYEPGQLLRAQQAAAAAAAPATPAATDSR